MAYIGLEPTVINAAIVDALDAAADAEAAALAAAAQASTSVSESAEAQADAGSAQTSATAAAASALSASNSATQAQGSATAAQNSATSAATLLDAFDDRYLGAKVNDPTLDNDGLSLLVGAIYFNTTVNEMRVWNGTAWIVTYTPSVTKASIGLGSVDNTSDANKPVSTAQQTALDLKLNAANPTYTGTLTGGTGVVNLGSGQFVKDASGNVGIGTTSPTTLLNRKVISAVGSWGGVFESSDSASKWARFGIDNFNTGLGCRIESSGGIVLYPAPDTIGATLTAAGNLGLGVTPSAWSLPAIESQYGCFSGRTGAIITHNAYSDGTWKYSSTNFASRYVQQNGMHSWSTALEGTAGNPISFTQAMTLDAAGRLTLGSATNGAIGSGTGLSMSFESGGTYQGGNIQSFSGNALNLNPLGNAIKFGSGWGQFDASGNLGIGVTPVAGLGKVQVAGNMCAGRVGIPIHIQDTADTNYGNAIYIPYDGGSSTLKAFRIRSSYATGALHFDPSINSQAQFTNPATLTYSTGFSLDSSGNLTVAGGTDTTGPVKIGITAVAALDIDCSVGNYFIKTINGNSTFTFSNAPASRAYGFTLELAHTSGVVAWPASVVWPNGTAPTLTTGKVHLFFFVTDDGGTKWRGGSAINYAS